MRKLYASLKAFYTKLSKRERMILYGTILFLGFLFIDRLILSPILRKMTQLEEEITGQEAGIKKSLHVLLRKEQIVADGKQLEKYATSSDLPDDKEMTVLLKELESMAQKSAVSIVYVKPGAIEQEQGMKRFLASLECEAEMREIVLFFHSLESSAKLLQIERYEIQQKNKESSTARCTIVVSKTLIGG